MIQPDPHEVEPRLDQPEPLTRVEQLARVLARSDADLSATETRQLELDVHASLTTVLDEYDLLAHEAQADRWATLLDIAPFTGDVADDVFTSGDYEHLEGALARHEAAGHDVTATLTALAPSITPGEDRADPGAQLVGQIDHATTKSRHGRGPRPRRVAGLIPTPAEPIPDDMQTALAERSKLIETAVRHELRHALDTGEGWIKRLGPIPRARRARTTWVAYAMTIALYRHRCEITGRTPLGDPQDITKAEQAAEYRTASAALRRAQSIGEPFTKAAPRRDAQRTDRARRL